MEEPLENSHNISKTKKKLCSIYGHSRMKSINPYEIYDHKSIANELVLLNLPSKEAPSVIVPPVGDLHFRIF